MSNEKKQSLNYEELVLETNNNINSYKSDKDVKIILSDENKQILNSEKLISKRNEWFSRLSELYSGKTEKTTFNLWGKVYFPQINPYEDIENWMNAALEMLANDANAIMNDEIFSPLAIEFGPYGVHFIDKIFGAEVFFQDGQWYNHYLKTEVGELQAPDLEKDETWSLAKKTAELFIKADVKLPVFGLPTIASALNIAVNLYGEEILVSLYTEPEKAFHDLKIINDVLIHIHKWYLKTLPIEQLQPVVSWLRTGPFGFGQFCGCTTQLISPDVYEELVAPLDEEILSVYPNGGMIHLCGSHSQHIPVWKNMKALRAVQINDRAAEDLELYFNGLRDDQIIYVNTFEGMTAQKAAQITKGKRLVIVEETKPIVIK